MVSAAKFKSVLNKSIGKKTVHANILKHVIGPKTLHCYVEFVHDFETMIVKLNEAEVKRKKKKKRKRIDHILSKFNSTYQEPLNYVLIIQKTF